MKLVNTASIIVIIIASVFLLIIGKSIILPLILAIFVWFFIREIRKWRNVFHLSENVFQNGC